MRNELVRIILLEGLNLNLTLDSKFHNHIADDGTRQPPCGKFIKRKSVELKALGLRGPKIAKQQGALHSEPGTSGAQHVANEIPNAELQSQAQNWLVHGRSPLEEVRHQWDLCFEKRKQDIKQEKDLTTIFKLYPIIQDPKGGVLISSDFDRLFPDAARKFYLRFPSLHSKLQKHIEKTCGTKLYEDTYKEYMTATDGEYKNYLLCTFLPVILQTNYRVKGNWRPSIKEAQQSFILEVQVRYWYITTVGTKPCGLNNILITFCSIRGIDLLALGNSISFCS
nr:uncharacterized protein LOC115260800 [Aedes albopictus]